MNIKSLLLGSAAALAAACYLPVPAAMASPGAGGGGGGAPALTQPKYEAVLAMTDPFESPAIGANETITSPQLAEGAGRLGKHPIFPWQCAEGDGGMKKPNLLGPQLALADKPGLVTIAAKTTSI